MIVLDAFKKKTINIKMENWTDLVMWDNITYYYVSNTTISKDQLPQIKKILNSYE
jgi:hypothetical protein